MDPQLTDSSSDSDISNSWSIVDQELCDAQASHGDKSVDNADNSVDKESISGSDGDSLEVIEDEEKRDADEFRDADVETDGISIITESEINEELDQALAWTEPKEKKYLHHPNTYLNSRLNVLLAISLAAVFGLGLGHFLGLQEECPLLNESATAQIEKLQQENQLLRNQLERLLHNERTFSTALDSTCSNDKYLVKKQISEDHAENQRYLKESGLNLHSLDKPELEEESVVNKGTAIDLNCGSAEKMQVTTQDYLKSIEPEWVRTYPWPKAIDADEDVNPSASIDNVNLNKKGNLKGNLQHFQNEKESPVDTMHSENIFVTDFIKQNLKEENIREQISDDRKDQSLEAVRMAVALLESHFTVDDRTSPDAKDTLSSLQSLTSDLEQSLVHFQKAITNGEMDHSGFFAQMLKKMKESVNRVLNTMEEVADDVDEQMHKVLYKLTRKLKKLKGKLQEKWCHLSEKYNNKSHPILDWLQSTILVDCKKPKHNRFEEKVHVPKEGNNDNEFPTLPLNYKNEKEMPEFIKNTKLSYTDKMMYNQFGEVDAENNLLKPKLELDNGPPLILDSPLIISKTFLEPEQTMSNGFDKHDTYGSQRTYTATKKFNSEAPCWQAENGKMYCETLDNKAVNLGSESRKMSKTDEKASQKKIKSPKSTHRVEDKNKAKHEEQKSEFVKSKTVEQRGWVFPDINNNMQNNASGEWMMKLAKGRAEQRRLIHRSDWVFDRAHARRIQRDMDKKTQWYFQRAQGREYCRFHPKSAECQTGKLHNFQWDNSKADTKNRKHYTEDKSHYFSKWSKKFGKWMKNSFSDWHKVKYHSQH